MRFKSVLVFLFAVALASTSLAGTKISGESQCKADPPAPVAIPDQPNHAFAIVKAHLGDTYGNLTYNKAARNFNPLMCMAAAKTIVQVSKIVKAGEIDPEKVVTPGIFVDRVVQVSDPQQEEELIRAGVAYAPAYEGVNA